MANIEDRFNIVGYRVIYAYTIDDDAHRGYIKIAERIFHLDDDDVELAKEDAMMLREKVLAELPKNAKLEKIWFGLRTELIGDITINSRLIYDLAEQKGLTTKAFRPNGVDVWFNADLSEIDSLIEYSRQEAQRLEKSRRDREINEFTDTKKTRGANKKVVKSSRPTRAIRFRPEQKKAIAKTVAHFSGPQDKDWKPRFLWNAKMRFGKTLSALEVAKQRGYKSVLIITHRPVVDDGWHEDFEKIFFDKPEYKYGSRNINDDENIGNFDDLTRQTEVKDGGFVFFVSMQYLRLSKLVGGKEKKSNKDKDAILNYPWELVVIDEAHEGTKSEQGSNVMRYLWLDTPDIASETQEEAKKAKRSKRKDLPHTLSLSGTPFNLYGDFSMSEIYTWDYSEEQEAKINWNKVNGDDPNPYDVLPKMHIFNHDIEGITGPIEVPGKTKGAGEFDDDELDETKAGFSFSQFFQVWTGKPKVDKAIIPGDKYKGRFMHEEQVIKFFYRLAVGTEEGSNYPFSTEEFRNSFRHTFWMLPGVEHAKALKNLLEQEYWTLEGEVIDNPYYESFKIINVAGKGDDDQDSKALRAVKKGIMEAERDGLYTITLSCGKLTTGVSIPQWTAVFYLKGNDDTRASAYLQTIFRVQTPAVFNGRQKTDAYVFDFSPTRSLRVFAEAVKLNVASRNGRSPFEPADTEAEEREGDKWLKYMPIRPLVPGQDGTMRHYDAKQLFDELNHHLTERAVRSGYADNSIYDPVAVMNLDEEGRQTLADLGKIINSSGNQESVPTIVTNPARPGNGSSKGDYDSDDPNPSKEKTEEEKKKDEWNKEKRSRMQILRAMSVRIPLLMYGAEVDDEHTGLDINNFTSLFKGDRASWDEFMPPGVTPEIFDKLRACYNPSVFRSAAKQIREYARDADRSDVEQRIHKIAEIFSFFRNPDKETVLTPWRVVNMHMSDTLGGYTFFDETFIDKANHRLTQPRFVIQEGVTENIFGAKDLESLEQIRVLELNSKTGLYPLYVTYSLYRARKNFYEEAHLLDDKKIVPDDCHIWDETLRENIFVVCKTEMARKITRRTLVGFRHNSDGTGISVNAVYPTWLLTEKDLVKGKVMKMPEGEKPSEEREHVTDLVGVLRARLDMFSHDIQSQKWWEKELKTKLDKQASEMIQFNAVVGNPPYNENDGSGASDDAANPIYQYFVRGGKSIKPDVLSLIMPSKWMVGGKPVLKPFRKEMMDDCHISKFVDFENSKEIFTTSHIDGGICYFTWQSEYEGLAEYIYKAEDGTYTVAKRALSDGGSDIVIRDERRQSIINKFQNGGASLKEIISETKPFGIRKDIFNTPENYPDSQLSDMPFDGSVLIHGVKGIKGGAKRKIGYVNPCIVKKNEKWINQYKVFFTTSYSTNAVTPPQPILAGPNEICTETFIVIGPFDTKYEMESLSKYIQTTFFKAALYFGRGSMQVSKDVFRFVPLLNFTADSDIDWSLPTSQIDIKLYEMFGLKPDEITFIEKMIKPAE